MMKGYKKCSACGKYLPKTQVCKTVKGAYNCDNLPRVGKLKTT